MVYPRLYFQVLRFTVDGVVLTDAQFTVRGALDVFSISLLGSDLQQQDILEIIVWPKVQVNLEYFQKQHSFKDIRI